jgi:hypothetical protein
VGRRHAAICGEGEVLEHHMGSKLCAMYVFRDMMRGPEMTGRELLPRGQQLLAV